MADYNSAYTGAQIDAGIALANTSTQPDDLATVATSGSYDDLGDLPTLGTAAATDATDYATAAQGDLADSAVQPGDDAADLGSGAATDGYVLTADGTGGAAWEAASGGGGTPAGSSGQFQFNDSSVFAAADLWQSTNIIEQRNSTNAQTFNLYNTYTDASNYERGFMRFVSNVFEIGTAALGTGVLRNIKVGNSSQGVGVAGGNALSAASFACGSSSTSGSFAFAAGQSTASAIGAIALGLSTTASAPVSIAMGQSAVASQTGQSALGFSFFAAAGDCQSSTFVLRATTTDATATEMSALSSSMARMIIGASKTWAFEITVAARSDGGVDNATYMYRGMIKRDASNNTVLVGTVDNFYTNETDAAWDVEVTADDTTESLKVMVTGAAATNINWTAKVILTEVGNV